MSAHTDIETTAFRPENMHFAAAEGAAARDGRTWERDRAVAKIYIAVFASVALLPFVASYVKLALTGAWLVGRFGEYSTHPFFVFHTVAGAVIFGAILLQYGLGFSAATHGRARAVLHRYLGRFLIVAFTVFAAQGLYVEWRASIFGIHLHPIYASATLVILASLCAYGLSGAWLNIRSGDIPAHLHDVVFFTIILSGVGFLRIYTVLIVLFGYRNTDFYFGDSYLFSVSLIEWGTFFTTLTLFFFVWLYHRRIEGRAARRKVWLTTIFFCAWPLLVIGSHLNIAHAPAPEGSTRSVVRF